MDLSMSEATYTLTDRKSRVAEKFKNIGTSTNEIYGLDTLSDKNGNKITFNYDPSARSSLDNTLILRSVTDTRGRALTVTNSGGSFDSLVTDSASRNVIYDVNSSTNQLDDITDAAGGLVKYEYDSAHRVTAVITPENQRTELTYDTTGRITQLKHVSTALGNPTWGFAYTAFDRSSGTPATTTTVTDPNGHNTVYTSDGKGRNSEVKNALGKSTKKTYSPNDDVKTTVGATGDGTQTSTNAYETTGDTYRLTSSTIPTGAGFTVNTYGSGATLYNVTKQTDTRGQATQYAYDPAGNTTKTTRQDGTAAKTSTKATPTPTTAAPSSTADPEGPRPRPAPCAKPGTPTTSRAPPGPPPRLIGPRTRTTPTVN
jgi:YD repeat-containing protein